MPQSGIVGSYGNYIFNLFRTSPTGIHARQQVTNVSICLHVGPSLLFSAFFFKKKKKIDSQFYERGVLKTLHNSVNVRNTACLRAQLSQSCLTLCDPGDRSPPGSSVLGILHARLQWVACPPPGHLIEPGNQTYSFCTTGGFFPPEPPGKFVLNISEL